MVTTRHLLNASAVDGGMIVLVCRTSRSHLADGDFGFDVSVWEFWFELCAHGGESGGVPPEGEFCHRRDLIELDSARGGDDR